MSSENVAVLEEELPDKGRSWTVLIDEEDVHTKRVNFWSLKSKNSRAFELLPGVHNIVVVTHETQVSSGPPLYQGYKLTEYVIYPYSPISMTFYAEKGHQYVIGGEINSSGQWTSWIKDTATGALVSKAIPPDPGDVEVVGKMCRVDSNYIISPVEQNDILYIPGGHFIDYKILGANHINRNPVGKVLVDTIYKTMASGRLQYKKAYLVDPIISKALILVAREGLTPDDKITKAELLRNKRVK